MALFLLGESARRTQSEYRAYLNTTTSASAMKVGIRIAMCFWNLLVAILLLVGGWWQRRQYRKTWGRSGAKPTLVCYQALYLFVFADGFTRLIVGSTGINHPSYAAGGAVMILPLAMLCIGRDNLYRFMEKRLMQIQKVHDGAFLAALSMSTVRVGQTLWIHKTEAELVEHGAGLDLHPNFRKGVIIEVLEDQSQGPAVMWQAEEGNPNGSESMLLRSVSKFDSIAGKESFADDMTKMLLNSLHYTTFENIVHVALGLPISSSTKMKFSVHAGQKIDFFVCYSWDDFKANTPMHLQTLKDFSEKFHKQHGRQPKFWFDKVLT